MKETKQQWYLDQARIAYARMKEAGLCIRLTDSQLASIICYQYGGELSMHIANIRRSQCNNRNQPYIHETD